MRMSFVLSHSGFVTKSWYTKGEIRRQIKARKAICKLYPKRS